LAGAAGDAGFGTADGSNYERLSLLKAKYDSINFFNSNRNIRSAKRRFKMTWNADVQCLCSDFRVGDVLCTAVFTPYQSPPTAKQWLSEVNQMKALTWKSMLAALNPSPLFEAVAAFAEERATRDKRPDRNKFSVMRRNNCVTTCNANDR